MNLVIRAFILFKTLHDGVNWNLYTCTVTHVIVIVMRHQDGRCMQSSVVGLNYFSDKEDLSWVVS